LYIKLWFESIKLSKRKQRSKKKLVDKGRLNDAKRWLLNHPQKDLISSYSRRYGVNHNIAEDELMHLGYYDEIHIQHYKKEGIEWEYRVEPLSGEMVVVPKDTEEHEIYQIHGLF
jgi:hypothetical protein